MARIGKRIRKGCGKIISFALAVVMVCSSIGIVPERVQAEDVNPWRGVSAADWMANIDDNLKLSQINLPGTHDSTTQYVDYSSSAQCQDTSIADQLNNGIRFLDLRLGMKKSGGFLGIGAKDEGTLKLVHGSLATCYADSGNKTVLMLDVVLQQCYDFLDEHSTETIVVSMKMDDGSFDRDVDFANRIYEKYITDDVKDYWFLQNGNPTLAQARGKIVLVRRYYNSDSGSDYGGNGTRIFWSDSVQSASSYVDPPWAGPYSVTGEGGSTTFFVQDQYNFSVDDKWKAVQKSLDTPPYTSANPVASTYFLNFTSTAGGSSPKNSADTIDSRLASYSMTRGKNYGWIIMDFATEALARHVFESNIYTKTAKDYVVETINALNIPQTIESDMVLLATGEMAGAGEGSSIVWSCEDHPELLKTYGSETWLVCPTDDDVTATIAANVSYGDYSDKKTFTVSIKKAVMNSKALEAAINRAKTVYDDPANNKYDLNALKSLIESAEVLLESGDITDEQIEEAIKSLDAAPENLELKTVYQLSENLIGWYPLTSDSKDISGNQNNGTAKGVTFSAENGAAFTGSGKLQSYISLPTSMFDGKDQMTISFWARDNGTASTRNQAVFGFGSGTEKDGDGTPNVYKYLLINTSFNDCLKAVVTINTWRAETGFTNECKFPKNTWTHITCVFEGTNFTLYKDGQLIGTKDTGIKLTDFGTNRVAYIGNSIWSINDDDYIGNVKDFRVYDCAVEAGQIAEIYKYEQIEKERLLEELTAAAGEIKDEIADLDAADYTASSWQALQKAIQEAENQASNPGSNTEIETVLTDLQEKKAALTSLGDKTELNILIAEADTVNPEDYTERTKQDFIAALADAKTVSGSNDVSQSEVDRVKKALADAMEALTVVTYVTVTFDADNGSDAIEVSVETGSRVTKQTEPQKEGYIFAGWYADGSEQEFDFQTAITSDITLKAKWTENQQSDGSGSGNTGEGSSGSGNTGSGDSGSGNSGSSSGSGNSGSSSGSGDSANEGLGGSGSGSEDTDDEDTENADSEPVDIASAKVTVAKTVYNGKTQKPKVTVICNGSTLNLNQDYTVSYSNSKKVGQGTATIKGKGKYTGKKSVKFNILPKKNKITKLTNNSSKKLTVKFSKSTGAKGYIVYYAATKNFKSAKKVKTTKNTCTLKGLKKGKTYYVRVCAYAKIGGKTVYSDYSAIVKKKITK